MITMKTNMEITVENLWLKWLSTNKPEINDLPNTSQTETWKILTRNDAISFGAYVANAIACNESEIADRAAGFIYNDRTGTYTKSR
jgi:hypothetical protein